MRIGIPGRDDLAEAVSRHQSGEPAYALDVYRRVIDAGRENAEVLNLAGIACAQLGKGAEAIEFLSRAVSLAPGFADAHRNLAIALRAAGRLEEAVAVHQKLIECQPDSFEAFNDLGVTWRRMGKLGKAATAYRRALELAPNFVDAMVNLGNVFQDQDNMEAACESYRRAIRANSALSAAHRNLGNALHRLGKIDEAIESYRRAVACDGSYALAHSDLGGALVENGALDEGIGELRRALEFAPGAANIHSNLGMALHYQGDPKSALSCYDESLRLKPGNSHALAYKSIALLSLERLDEYRALVDYDKLLYANDVDTPDGFRDQDEFNRALAAFASTHPTLMGKDDRRPGISGELLSEPVGPMFQLEAVVRKEVERYIQLLPENDPHPFVKRRPSSFRMIGWANVVDSGSDPHIHPHAWLSGVYYVDTGGVVGKGNGSDDGCLEFGPPDPKFGITSNPEFRIVRPRDSRILLFPSFFWHGIRDFTSEHKRISYAFDISPV